MKTLRANGSRLKSDAGRPKKWVNNNKDEEHIKYMFDRFGVYNTKTHKIDKKTGNLIKK